MKCDTAVRGLVRTSVIPVFLIVIGIFVWGLRYKLSLYDSPGGVSHSVAEAKLLSPNERSGSVQLSTQIGPQFIPASPRYSRIFLIAVLPSGSVPVRMVRAKASTSQDAQSIDGCTTSFFFFRPPPASFTA